jgi:ubiquinone/menaquinone biosynthesis C-methylase UbiE
MPEFPEHYILATGGKDVRRLRILHEVYGPGTEVLLGRFGLRDGMRVLEVGCGSGNTACRVAKRVGPSGSVLGIDNSPDQVEQARQMARNRGLRNVEFQVADAYSPRLPEESFDLAYCRLVLMHLTHPKDALAIMRSLVKPGGAVACEEMVQSVWLCDPPSDPVRRFHELAMALGERIGEHFCLGAELHRLFYEVGFQQPEVGANFPLAIRGEQKQLLGLTFDEFGPELVRLGLASLEEVERVTAGLMAVAADQTTLMGFPLVTQVWAKR